MAGIAPGPRALSEWFIIRQMDDEVLVYDLRNQNITSLNAFAAAVWHACDGQADPASIARRLETEGYAVADLEAITLAHAASESPYGWECVWPTPYCDAGTWSCVQCLDNGGCLDPIFWQCVNNECTA